MRSEVCMTPAARIASAIELVALVLEPWGEGTQNDSPLPLAPSREGGASRGSGTPG